MRIILSSNPYRDKGLRTALEMCIRDSLWISWLHTAWVRTEFSLRTVLTSYTAVLWRHHALG